MKKLGIDNLEAESQIVDYNANKIKFASLLSAHPIHSEDKNLMSLVWICKLANESLISLITTYLIETPEDELFINSLPLNDSRYFIGTKIANDLILDNIPRFITDMEFNSSIDINNETNYFLLDAVEVKKEKCFRDSFSVPINIFSSFKFVDNCITNLLTNINDLSLASLSATDSENEITDIFVVDCVKNIKSMAPIKRTNAICMILDLYNSSKDENNSLLVSYNNETKFKKSKFKKVTLDNLLQQFMLQDNEFKIEFSFALRFKNTEKEYTCMKGINKNNKLVLFMFDLDTLTHIKNLIEIY